MRRIADWRAPRGACGEVQTLGDALVVPVVCELESEDEEAKTTEFGLWSINLLSHEERFIKATLTDKAPRTNNVGKNFDC